MSIKSLAASAAHAVQDASLRVRLAARVRDPVELERAVAAARTRASSAALAAGFEASNQPRAALDAFFAQRNRVFATDGAEIMDAGTLVRELERGPASFSVQPAGASSPKKATAAQQRLLEATNRAFDRAYTQVLTKDLIKNGDLSPWRSYATAGGLMGGAAAAGALGWSVTGDE